MTDRSKNKESGSYRYQGTLIEISTQPKQSTYLLGNQEQQVATETIRQVWHVRQVVYNKIYPAVASFAHDPHDAQSCVLYTRNKMGGISSTARIAFNIAPLGIPEKRLVPDLILQLNREQRTFAELGRFVIADDARGALKNYYRAFYQLGIEQGIDTYIMFVRPKWVGFYRRLMRAKVAAELTETFGSDSKYVVMTWRLQETTPRFFSWSGAQAYPMHDVTTGEPA